MVKRIRMQGLQLKFSPLLDLFDYLLSLTRLVKLLCLALIFLVLARLDGSP